ncbi:ribosome maturation factor RimP [Arthrobacter sp. H41]|uniref:ribosome maturation factor RimP n=1 Tax=Arthrobacter sp. H41 TaxID=1312978 RepID=UPI0004B2530F|nr:ribosome maturation factor RimP [Arthrobacter sp. H41]
MIYNIIEWEAAMAVQPGNGNRAAPRKTALDAELQAEAQRLRTRLQPVVEQHDLYLEEIDIKLAGAHRTVHVIVDLPEDRQGSVGLDIISDVSLELSQAMDNDPDDDGRPYSLEISSPGVSRPLTEPRHWRRNVGRMILVKPVQGDEVLGRLQEVSATGIRLVPQLPVKKGMKPKQGEPTSIEFSRIRKGTVQVEFAHADEHQTEDGAGHPENSGARHPA